MGEHFTEEGSGLVGTIRTIEDALKAHHLATADPEKDGLLTGPEHEEKYGLERAAASKAHWQYVADNRSVAEVTDEEAPAAPPVETAAAPAAPENAAVDRPII
jgi:hypothetical protein